jgi:hypothetical protein
MSFQKRSFWNWGNEMNKVDVVLGFVGAFEHLRRILVKFWRVSTFPVLLGLVCPAGWLAGWMSVCPSVLIRAKWYKEWSDLVEILTA